jgi:mRNA interferase MazF
MSFQRGDVVLVKYPFADGVGSKVRPAVVVQSDMNNARLDNTIVVQITSRTQFARTEPTQLLIELSTPAGQQSGLLSDSAVSCENLFTVRQDIVIRKIGSLPADLMRRVDACLKASLGIA